MVDEAAAAFGLVPVYAGGNEPTPLYIWPDNVPSWNLFQAVSTQWIRSDGQPTGLYYPGVETVMRMLKISGPKRAQMFSDVQVMERATLKALSERRK